jgi:hypothetical protein
MFMGTEIGIQEIIIISTERNRIWVFFLTAIGLGSSVSYVKL